ncbi:agglutinin biogenesis protein MshI [Sulfuriferula sp. AH1]|uniref:agglutinin biogenesis protein MshI n=1 Tax=Sulfuriferula sp. AH1 TaxID=1985873 RepID=UPI001CB8AA51|nr:agglutinin biogenesis protein MshI [Sulfuriferula sp. AH1]
MVFELQADGICVTRVTRTAHARPKVQLAVFYPFAQTEASALLSRIHKELHAKRYECSHLLSPGEYQILTVETPGVPQEELKTAVRWLLKDMLDYHVDDATIDVLDIPVDKNAPARKAMMYVVAARNQLIAQRQTLFDSVQIPLKVIDIPELAQRNIASLIAPANRGLALLSFDQNGSLLTISFNGELYLSRRLDINLTQLGSVDGEQQGNLFEKLTLELQRTFDHIDRQYHFINLAKLVLTPATPEMSALSTYLTDNLYIPVETLELSSIFDLPPELLPIQQQSRFRTSMGAALRYEDKTP